MRLEGKRAGKVAAHRRIGPIDIIGHLIGPAISHFGLYRFLHGGVLGGIGHGRSVHHHPSGATHQNGPETVFLPHHAANGRDPRLRHAIVVRAHLRPKIPPHGIQTLVPSGQEHLCIRRRFERKRIMGTRIGLILETRKLQRQRIAVLFPPILLVITHGLAVQEVEHLQTHGIRPGLSIGEGNILQAAIGNHKLLIVNKLFARPIDHHLGVCSAFCCADTGAHRTTFRHRSGARNKDPTGLRHKFMRLRKKAEHGKTLLTVHLLAAFALPFHPGIDLIISAARQLHGEAAAGLHLTGSQRSAIGRNHLETNR